jgi:hypothetical protein
MSASDTSMRFVNALFGGVVTWMPSQSGSKIEPQRPHCPVAGTTSLRGASAQS